MDSFAVILTIYLHPVGDCGSRWGFWADGLAGMGGTGEKARGGGESEEHRHGARGCCPAGAEAPRQRAQAEAGG